jgi:hypothetical protein
LLDGVGAKLTCGRARRDRREKKRYNDGYGPRKVGAAVHRQLTPYDDVNSGKKRFNAIWRKRAGDGYSDSTSDLVNCSLRPAFAE